MIALILKIIATIYVLGFFGILWLNLSIGPVTTALAFARAAVWPIWWATGWPRGELGGI